MKVAISLPDPVFLAAERLARRMRISRSQLYATALGEYVAVHDDARVTEQLDAVYDVNSSALDAGLAAAQERVLDDEAW